MDLPQYTSFLNADNMSEFWKVLKWLMFYVAPIVMIWFAIQSVQEFIYRLKSSTTEKDEDFDEDNDVYYYKD
ncbi:hypothetical protein [Bacillus thuringiensis]|uniref:hypothetical protein n=1 Tax=Bacillus thuringiensis TaxID=1428 RepID=UPI000BF62A90|nr:hypothetical protein [Bacillus thuringiensis]MEB9081910.1 hypothetical protein [Bacillus cereus]MED2683526.1 hypothetical protein [Bacillus thuringiensis]PEV45894.1 hypothetical protein CN432_19635 [Bacillus thuringiensis]PFV85123.1 hypothetical protein COL06_22155 [Bacillus thuringiensis]HDR6318930.1 hypothetical protein [Bacillus thuringiensis]